MYPSARITLLHSRARLMPKFEGALHGEGTHSPQLPSPLVSNVLCVEVMSALQSLNVEVVLNDRLDFSSLPTKHTSTSASFATEKVVKTQTGRELRADLILLCTGQTPNTAIMRDAIPEAVGPSGEVRVLRTLQVAVPRPPPPAPATKRQLSAVAATFIEPECPSPSLVSTTTSSLAGEWDPSDAHLHAPYAHMFAIGDAADAWGALKAGHNAYYQAEVAARNIVRLVRREMRAASASRSVDERVVADDLPFFCDDEAGVQTQTEEEEELERYLPGPPAIKLSVGLTKSVYQINGQVGRKDGVNEDLDALLMWAFFGARRGH